MAILHYQLQVEGMPDDLFVVRRFSGQEGLSNDQAGCTGFRYEIQLASRTSMMTWEEMVDRSAELILYRNHRCVKRVHGIIRQFSRHDRGHHHTFYSLQLVPALERLSLRHNSRIFQQKTVPEIITILLQEMGIEEYAFALRREMAPREFCVQYRETDLDFLHRIAAEEGIIYSFEHEAGKHVLLFSDVSEALPKLPEPLLYHRNAGGERAHVAISTFTQHQRTEFSHAELRDYSFKKPQYSLSNTAQDHSAPWQSYEYFDAPGRYKSDVTGRPFSQIRLEYLRRRTNRAEGESDQAQLQAGIRFQLLGHDDLALNREWLTVSVHHEGEQPQALEEEAGSGATTYHNHFEVIPADKVWRAQPQPKPLVDGPMIATVVGPAGEEIFCDDYGRVKVHFAWDRLSQQNDHSSCWIRVSQGWAGSQYGFMALPRVGHEVIVSFLNGDPDQPIITGRTYNVSNLPPYRLPENQTRTVFKTKSHRGEGFNELSFDDKQDNELVYLKAEKNMQVQVKNSQDIQIAYDTTTQIGHDEYRSIAHDRHLTVEGQQQHMTQGDHIAQVQGDKHDSVEGDWAQKIMGALGINADGELTLKSNSKITLQVGGNFVVVDNGGVFVNGSAVNINSGGTPGSVSVPSSVSSLQTAAQNGSPFILDCQR